MLMRPAHALHPLHLDACPNASPDLWTSSRALHLQQLAREADRDDARAAMTLSLTYGTLAGRTCSSSRARLMEMTPALQPMPFRL